MQATSKFIALVSSTALVGCSLVGIRDAEEPSHTIVGQAGKVEVRAYGPRIAAEVQVTDDEITARREGFTKLAGYIFGNNAVRQKIAMTAPVAQTSETIAMTAPVSAVQDSGGKWSIRFFMPAQYTLKTLPAPKDQAVHLITVPAETIAVLRFSGSTSAAAVAEKRQELLSALSSSAWRPDGATMTWFYDPPWTIPFLRRNEVAVLVTDRL